MVEEATYYSAICSKELYNYDAKNKFKDYIKNYPNGRFINDVYSNLGDVFQKLFKNPGRLIGMVKKVGNKIEEKIKSGEIKESELMKESYNSIETFNKLELIDELIENKSSHNNN